MGLRLTSSLFLFIQTPCMAQHAGMTYHWLLEHPHMCAQANSLGLTLTFLCIHVPHAHLPPFLTLLPAVAGALPQSSATYYESYLAGSCGFRDTIASNLFIGEALLGLTHHAIAL